MKTKYLASLFATAIIAFASAGTVFGQATAPKPDLMVNAERPKLTRFDLDFPGGTPRELVAHIQHATGRPLNIIMRDEDATAKLPALKLKNTTVVDLFGALRNIGQSTEKVPMGVDDFGKSIFGEKFRTFQFVSRGSEPDDNSIWTFVSEVRTAAPRATEPKSIRYYNLSTYLETFKIDDITTAVRTGWEMVGDPSGAKFSFHKDTKLLIAVGRPDQLAVIDSVLKQLAPTALKQVAASSEVTARQQELLELRQQLADRQRELTPSHPTMVNLRQTIDKLERELAGRSTGNVLRGKVYIWGQVRTQGPVEIPTDEKFTVGKAILRAGGFGEFANKQKVKLIRTLPDDTKKEEILNVEEIFDKGNTEKDKPVQDGDFIIVPEKMWNL